MLLAENIKRLYNVVEIDKKYTHTTHILNAIDENLFYIEFLNKLDISEMVMVLLKEEMLFYQYRRFEDILYNRFFNLPKGETTTQIDLSNMKKTVKEVQNGVYFYKNSYLNEHRDEYYDCNASIKSYYLNQEWQSDNFPKELREKIFSADNYTTYMNKHSEYLFVLEHNGSYSLYYNFNDQ